MNYAEHSIWTHPGAFGPQLLALPVAPTAFAGGLEWLMVHHAAARSSDLGVPPYAEADRSARFAQRLLATLLQRDSRELSQTRCAAELLYVTCRDFSLMAVSAMRARGVAARLRVGFVDYLVDDFWEDHWLCEYFSGGEWRCFDAQLGPNDRQQLAIDFPVDDIPASHFRCAAQMWRELRGGTADPARCGVSFLGLLGPWICACNLLRDAAALCKVETLPWDVWGLSVDIAEKRAVDAEQEQVLDQLAESILSFQKLRPDADLTASNFTWAVPHGSVQTQVGEHFESCSIV